MSFGKNLINLIACLIFTILGVFSMFPLMAQDTTFVSAVSSGGNI